LTPGFDTQVEPVSLQAIEAVMGAPPLRILVVVAAVVALALGTLGWAVAVASHRLDARELVLLALLGAMLLLARRAPLPLSAHQHLVVGTAPLFAATLLLPAPPVMVVAAAAVCAGDRSRHPPWLQTAFNAAVAALQVAAGAVVYEVVTGGAPLATLPSVLLLTAAVAVALAMYACNAGLLECIVAVQQRQVSPPDIWRRRRLDGLSDGALYVLGLLIAMLTVVHPWAVLLLAVPALVVYRSLRASLVLQRQLSHRATHDALTDVGNRTLFTDRARQALARAARTRGSLAVLFLDIDSFKRVNDTLGHGVGDDLLKVIARRLVESVRPEDTVARLGGDEFILLLEDCDAAAAVEVAAAVLAALRAPVSLAGRQLVVDASVGIVPTTGGHDSVEDLLRSADIAMYRAKALGKGRFEVFAPAMATAVEEQVTLEAELRRAVERDELVVHYQPTVDLAGGTITGCEALVRWQHPEHGLIPPGRFIPLAEETGLIVPIGRRVLREACGQAQRWQAGIPDGEPFSVSVNLSTRQLQEPGLVEEVAASLAESGIDPARLVLEVTESAMMQDADDALQIMQALKALGVRLALDDFGTGYSSLSYLHRFPFDVLKIDKAFVEPLEVATRHRSLASTIVKMGRSLALEMVAEGIETREQADALRLLGCESGQGYFFARPLAPAALESLMGAARSDPPRHGLRLLPHAS
jgi:diguanylate cyclase (GGDEF)-like protein